jgi:two-component system, NarL family, sensor kinase
MLASTKIYLDIASSDEDARVDLIERCKEHIHKTINEVRSLSHKLVAATPKGLNLVDAIDELLEPYILSKAFRIHYDEDGDLNSLPLNMKIGLLRVLQEALQNTAKYSKAKNLWIQIAVDGQLSLLIKDDGIGFDPAVEKQGIGLKNIQERIWKMNGKFDIIAAPRSGLRDQGAGTGDKGVNFTT